MALPTILMAEDDPDDQVLLREALEESDTEGDLRFVGDGQELLDYLRASASGDVISPRPRLILLDLNMPRKDGREALVEVKADPEFRRIPVVVVSTSASPEDVFLSYDHGASSFVTKPASFDGLVDLMNTIGEYWFETVRLPNAHNH